MALLTLSPYKAKEFPLSGLQGISDHTLEIHFGLYAGYVKNTNLLTEQLVDLAGKGQAATPTYHELTRRLPFEYNGMVLHEWYFDNLTATVAGRSPARRRSAGPSGSRSATSRPGSATSPRSAGCVGSAGP